MNATQQIMLKPIGFVKKTSATMSVKADSTVSAIILNEDLIEAVEGIEDFSHIWVIFWMDKISMRSRCSMKVHPRGRKDMPLLGTFATRTPYRPNPIGLTLVALLGVDDNVLSVSGLDALDGTPILDVKPYDSWDAAPDARVPGWWRRLETERDERLCERPNAKRRE